jgi:hypothetical protein
MIQSVQGEDMKGKLTINLIKEYLKLAILPYCIAALVWTMMIFIGAGYDWAFVGAMCGSMACAAWGWKMIFTDSAKGGRSGLYQGLPVSAGEQRTARGLAACAGMVIVLAGFIVMTAVIWSQIEFWGAQFVYRMDSPSRNYAEWLYEIYLEGGGTL